MSVHGASHSHGSQGASQAGQTDSSCGTNSSSGTDSSNAASMWQQILQMLLQQAGNATGSGGGTSSV
jgi:hypothetical protein